MGKANKTALITGVTGQDGSYLAELLLEKGYTVHGIIRRSSQFNTSRLESIFQDPHEKNRRLNLVYGDLCDAGCIINLVNKIRPDEIYNLGAQSHVRVSFDIPIYTTETIVKGTLALLEAIRTAKEHGQEIKFYQASSSEMFGSSPPPQNEKTRFQPRSPYACAKVYAHSITVNYREAYGLFATSGILFNHECVSENTPLVVRNKKSSVITIKRAKDIRKAREKNRSVQQWCPDDIEIWDGEKFADLRLITATKRDGSDDFRCRTVNTRHGVVEATNHHNMLLEDGSKMSNRTVLVGQKLMHGSFPGGGCMARISHEEAVFLGMMAGDGWIGKDGRANFVCNNSEEMELFRKLWSGVGLGTLSIQTVKTEYGKAVQARLCGNSSYLKLKRSELYTEDGFKKVPDCVLNASKEAMLAFLIGYNMADGLKANPCTYEFKSFKTDSALLAQGLLFLISQTTGQDFNITFEEDEKYYGYYSINFLSPTNNATKESKALDLLGTGMSQRQISEETGISRNFIQKISNGGHAQLVHHLARPKDEVKKTLCHRQQPVWVYDVETSSGKFMGGIGTMVVSNSPRRGETFVTRKITRAIANILFDRQKKIYLGNLDARRDWGYAPDYVKAMWMMLQHHKPEDFVVATGESHSVREFLEEAFRQAKLNYEDYVEIDKRYFRPTEVDSLIGDAAKARKELGWKPEVKFKELVKIMLEADKEKVKKEVEFMQDRNE